MQWTIAALVIACLAWEPASRASGILMTAAPGAEFLSAPATFADGTHADLRTGGGTIPIEPASQLPGVYSEFSSPRTRAHLSRLATHPVAARAYLDHLMRLAARGGSAVQRAELRQLHYGPDGWRSTAIAMPP